MEAALLRARFPELGPRWVWARVAWGSLRLCEASREPRVFRNWDGYKPGQKQLGGGKFLECSLAWERVPWVGAWLAEGCRGVGQAVLPGLWVKQNCFIVVKYA